MKLFNQVMGKKPRNNMFDLSHERKFSTDMAKLTPIICEEVLPGDKFIMNTEILTRLAPLVSPMMHRVDVYTHFFFVPNRIIWDNWEKFITGGTDGLQTPVLPYVQINSSTPETEWNNKSLLNFLGVQSADDPQALSARYNALPFRAYQTIFNEYYRDQNLQDEVEVVKSDGNTVTGNGILAMRKRCWEKDYFTSALPWTQRGGEVNLPFDAQYNPTYKQASVVREFSGGLSNSAALSVNSGELQDDTYTALRIENLEDEQNITSSSVTINDLRRATKLQEWLEKNARGGARYIEQIFSHFGVISSDARLQRPEYLGGGKSPIVISEVLQTSRTEGSPQGNMAGHGVSVGNTHQFKKRFEEHGYVIGIMSIMPRTAYYQGVRRAFLKQSKLDYFWPEFANLGEQPVWNQELYNFWTDVDEQVDVFGYQSRYAEYKFIPDSVHGDFTGNLEHWHMARKFTNAPALNSAFVAAQPDDRVFAVINTGQDNIYCQVYNNLKAVRPIPYFSIPSL